MEKPIKPKKKKATFKPVDLVRVALEEYFERHAVGVKFPPAPKTRGARIDQSLLPYAQQWAKNEQGGVYQLILRFTNEQKEAFDKAYEAIRIGEEAE